MQVMRIPLSGIYIWWDDVNCIFFTSHNQVPTAQIDRDIKPNLDLDNMQKFLYFYQTGKWCLMVQHIL